MGHYLLRYVLAPDYLERREQHRAVHLNHARAAVAGGGLLLGGPMADAGEGALLLFRGDGPDAAEAFARADPYVVHGIVTHWRVDRWLTVVGADAAEPLPPGLAAA